jgi:hypothetical protein
MFNSSRIIHAPVAEMQSILKNNSLEILQMYLVIDKESSFDGEPNTARTGQAGTHRVFEHFPGFGGSLFRG